MLLNSFIERQKELLLAEKQRLNERIKKLEIYPDYGDVGEDNLQEIEDYETNSSIKEELELLLNKVNGALAAIEIGSYGRCKKCQKEIEKGRLEVMPYADLCVKCEK